MEGLSIEEKAKAYDKAIAHAKKLLKTIGNATLGNLVLKNEFKNMFPALEESEDERIRKALITYFSDEDESYDGIPYPNIRAWLEKQGEQKPIKEHNACEFCEDKYGCVSPCSMKLIEEEKPVDKVEQKFKVGDKIKFAKEPKYPAREIIAIQNDAYYFDEVVYLPFNRQDEWELVEQKPTVEMKTPEESLGIDSDTYNKIVDECVYGEQKPAWSEEDDKMSRFIGNAITVDDASIYLESKGIQVIDAHVWLNGLKDKVQPKQEWSDVDKDILFRTIDNLKFLRDTISIDPNYAINIINIEREITWLNSLRPQNKTYYWTENEIKFAISDFIRGAESYEKMVEKLRCLKPQSQWKPSDEQMLAINTAINVLGKGTINGKYLIKLQEQLKKLREK